MLTKRQFAKRVRVNVFTRMEVLLEDDDFSHDLDRPEGRAVSDMSIEDALEWMAYNDEFAGHGDYPTADEVLEEVYQEYRRTMERRHGNAG